MSEKIKPLIKYLVEEGSLAADDLKTCFDEILSGEATPVQMAAFITGLKMRGETPQDISIGAKCLLSKVTSIGDGDDNDDRTMDIVGTGGDGKASWNISTATAFVVAGAGVPVAKHGNRAVSSSSGAADVLKALGVNLDADIGLVQRALSELGICFLMAPKHHSAMRHIAPVRAELGYRTIFNMLGPLANPAFVRRIMVGVYDKALLEPFALALQDLGTTHALIVHGRDGLDEVTTTTETDAILLKDGTIKEMVLSPKDIGLNYAAPDDLVGGSPDENAKALRQVLRGEPSAYKDIVVLNAAAALFGGGHAETLQEGAKMAEKSIDEGRALNKLHALVSITGGGS